MDRISVTISSDRNTDRPLKRLALERRRYPPGIAGIALSHHACCETHIGHSPGDRSLYRRELREQPAFGGCRRIVYGGPALRRLDRRNTVREGRESERPANVVAVMNR